MAKTKPVGEDGERGVVIMVASSAAFDGQPGQGNVLFPGAAVLVAYTL